MIINILTFKLQLFLFFISLWLFYRRSCRLSPESVKSYCLLDFYSSTDDQESMIPVVVLRLETWNSSPKIASWGSWIASSATNLATTLTMSPANLAKFQEWRLSSASYQSEFSLNFALEDAVSFHSSL